jgi:Kelch motif protein
MRRTLIALCCIATLAGCKDKSRSWQPRWRQAAPLIEKRGGAAAVQVNGFIYVMGGHFRDDHQSTEYAQIKDDGSLGPWQIGPPLHEARAYFDAVYHNGWIYVIGGGAGEGGLVLLRSVERARVLPDGKLSPWQQEPVGMIMPRRCNKTVLIDGSIYALGGFGGDMLNTVEHTKILPDGSTSEWLEEPERLTIMRYISGVKYVDGAVYVVGSHDQSTGAGLKDVEWGKIKDEAGFGAWKRTSPLQVPRYGLGLVGHAGRLYAFGGLNGPEFLDSVESAPILPGGGLGEWRLQTVKLSSRRAMMAVVTYKGWVYSLGGSGTNAVEYATFNEAGELGSWFSEAELKALREQKQEVPLAVRLPILGTVAQVEHAPPYVYLFVRLQGRGEGWVAGPAGEFRVGDRVRFGGGAMMADFFSKTLNKRFEHVLFVAELRKDE